MKRKNGEETVRRWGTTTKTEGEAVQVIVTWPAGL